MERADFEGQMGTRWKQRAVGESTQFSLVLHPVLSAHSALYAYSELTELDFVSLAHVSVRRGVELGEVPQAIYLRDLKKPKPREI